MCLRRVRVRAAVTEPSIHFSRVNSSGNFAIFAAIRRASFLTCKPDADQFLIGERNETFTVLRITSRSLCYLKRILFEPLNVGITERGRQGLDPRKTKGKNNGGRLT